MRYSTSIMVVLLSLLAVGCKSYEPLKTVDVVNLQQYAGKWYEIAAFPTSFEKGCSCVTAEYTVTEKGYVQVVNRCKKNDKWTDAKGKTFVKDDETNAKLAVQFFWPFKGKYWVLDLGPDYSYALVGHPNRKHLWILSRTPYMDEDTYQGILDIASSKGFDINKLRLMEQSCDN